MPAFTRDVFDRLSAPGPRLGWLADWLTGSVWSPGRFSAFQPVQYLQEGERTVNEIEEVIAASAPRTYDELTTVPANREILQFLDSPEPSAVMVFDGLSLREVPALLRLADAAGFTVEEKGIGLAALPSETVDFVDQRLGCGRVGPSSLGGRRDLKDRGIQAYYYAHPGERHTLDPDARALLLWSSFPDNTYKDSGARFAEHFMQIQVLLESAWKATVMSIPRGRRILVTSDHGYVFLGAGLSFTRNREELRPLTAYLGGERYARLSVSDEPPTHDDLKIYPERDVAVLKGRVQLHPPGPASNKLYKHGGLSLMEMLTPWLVLTR